MLLDLLTPAEEADRSNVFDVALLAGRLGDATSWLGALPELDAVPMGYFGASTGAAVLELNREAQAELRCENELVVVPGATHLFEEAGALDAVARLARDWFLSRLATAP